MAPNLKGVHRRSGLHKLPYSLPVQVPGYEYLDMGVACQIQPGADLLQRVWVHLVVGLGRIENDAADAMSEASCQANGLLGLVIHYVHWGHARNLRWHMLVKGLHSPQGVSHNQSYVRRYGARGSRPSQPGAQGGGAGHASAYHSRIVHYARDTGVDMTRSYRYNRYSACRCYALPAGSSPSGAVREGTADSGLVQAE